MTLQEWLHHPLTYVLLLGALTGVGTCIFKFGKWSGQVNSDRESLRQFVSEVRDKLAEISRNMEQIFSRLPSPALASGSPVRLTELGERISQKLEARTWAMHESENLLDQVKGRQDYEIHDLATECAEANMSLMLTWKES